MSSVGGRLGHRTLTGPVPTPDDVGRDWCMSCADPYSGISFRFPCSWHTKVESRCRSVVGAVVEVARTRQGVSDAGVHTERRCL